MPEQHSTTTTSPDDPDGGSAPPAAYARGAAKHYGSGASEVRALDGVDITFSTGEFTAIMGPSGSGKSTLMHCMAGLDTLTAGNVFIDGDDVSAMSDRERTVLRRDKLGFIFQAFNLVPTLSLDPPTGLWDRRFGAGWSLGWCVCAGWRVLGRFGACGTGVRGCGGLVALGVGLRCAGR